MWAAPFAVAVDGLLVPVRAHPRLDPLLRRLLAPLLTPDEPPPDSGYAAHLADEPGEFHQLYWGGCVVARTHHPARLVEGLLRHLAGHRAPGAGVVRLAATVLVQDGRAVVAPVALRSALPKLQSPLRRFGIELADAPWADLDPAAGEVVLHSQIRPWTDIDGHEMDDFSDRTPRPEPPAPTPGRYQLQAIVLPRHHHHDQDDRDDLISPASAVSHVAGLVAAPSKLGPDGLQRLADLVATIPTVALSTEGLPSELAAALDRLLRRPAQGS